MYKNNDLLVCGKYYNTSDVFKINEDAQISVEEFGDQKVVVVDDFYSNPELVRYMSLNNFASKLNNMEYPGFKTSFYINQKMNVRWYTDVIDDVYRKEEPINFAPYYDTIDRIDFNLVKSSEVYNWNYDIPNKACHPHIDMNEKNIKYGAVVYLNTEDEYTAGVNGTAFYKHINTNVIDCNWRIQKHYRQSGYPVIDDVFYQSDTIHCNDWINDGNEHWEKVHLTQMKYNRLVLYPSTYFHQAYLNNDDFNDPNPATGHRIVQAIFLRGKE